MVFTQRKTDHRHDMRLLTQTITAVTPVPDIEKIPHFTREINPSKYQLICRATKDLRKG